MEQKLKRIILCLYGIAAIEMGAIIYSMILKIQLFRMTSEFGLSTSGIDFFGFSVVSSVFLLIATFKVIQGLKEKKSWAWIGAIVVCGFATPGFSIPLALYGFYLLFQDDVRLPFQKELEDKIKI